VSVGQLVVAALHKKMLNLAAAVARENANV